MKTVNSLPGWPPQSGGAFTRGEIFPQSTEEVTIERVLLEKEGHIAFSCRFQGRSIPYDFFIGDSKMAEEYIKILNDNRGKTLFEIGFIEIPSD